MVSRHISRICLVGCVALLLSASPANHAAKAAENDGWVKLQRLKPDSSEPSAEPIVGSVVFDPAVSLPREAMVYRVKTTPINAEVVKSLIRKLGMREPDATRAIQIAPDGSKASYRDEDTWENLFYYGSDGVIVYDAGEGEIGGGPVPSKADAEAIAGRFIHDANLFPPGATLVIPPYSVDVERMPENGGPEPVVVDRIVSFAFRRHGGPVESDYMDVWVGHKGVIHQLTRNSREVEPLKLYPLKDAADLAEDIRFRRGQVNLKHYCPSVRVRSAHLYYGQPSYATRAEHIQPTFRLVCEATDGGRTTRFSAFIPAVKDHLTEPVESPDRGW